MPTIPLYVDIVFMRNTQVVISLLDRGVSCSPWSVEESLGSCTNWCVKGEKARPNTSNRALVSFIQVFEIEGGDRVEVTGCIRVLSRHCRAPLLTCASLCTLFVSNLMAKQRGM